MSCSYSADCFRYEGEVYCRVTNRRLKYEQVGLLMSADQTTITHPLPLFGMRSSPAAADWRYFTYSQTDPPIRLPVIFKKRNCQNNSYRGCEELSENDMVEVQGYEGRLFKVTLFTTM